MMASAQHSSPTIPHSPSFLSQKITRQCEEGVEFMELVAELLLLRSGSKAKALHPVTHSGDSYSKSRDAIVANTKSLALSIKELTKQLKEEELEEVDSVISQISDKVTVLTEAAAQAAYISAMHDKSSVSSKEGVVDQYMFAKARYIISTACNSFSVDHGTISNSSILKQMQNIATNLSRLRNGCQKASENSTLPENERAQFSACVQCLDGSSATFVACVKSYLTTNKPEDRKNMSMFAIPLKIAVNSVVEYSSSQRFGSIPAKLSPRGEQSQTEILAGAMSVVSAAVQMLNTVVSLLEDKGDSTGGGVNGGKNLNSAERKALEDRHWQKLVSCARAVADSCRMLALSIREHTPRSTPQVTPPLRRANSSGSGVQQQL